MSASEPKPDSVPWKEILPSLNGYAKLLLETRHWFRRPGAYSYLKGKEAGDYVMEAVAKYLEHPEKFDASKRSLVGYLKEHIIRSLISNDATSSENQTNIDPAADELEGLDALETTFFSSVLPQHASDIEEMIDFKQIICYIVAELKDDDIAQNILLGRVEGLERRDIAEEFGMTAHQYDNGMRRLLTVSLHAAKHFNIVVGSQ
jgi:hypothetical protein